MNDDDWQATVEAPASDALTDYDRDCLPLYVRLLDAADDGADDAEIARIVLGIDLKSGAAIARRIFDSHMRRARWISERGYRALL